MLEELLYALNECFDGEGADGGVFLEREDPGLFYILDSLKPEEASRPIVGMSIANHAYHLSFAINVFIRRITGDENARDIDWSASWRDHPLSGAEWENLKEELAALRKRAILLARGYSAGEIEHSSLYFRLVSGLLTHTVFHLGIIRVKFDELKGSSYPAIFD